MNIGPLFKKASKPQPPPEIKKPNNPIYPSQFAPPPNMYMNYPNQQHIPNTYPIPMHPPERPNLPPNMMNPQFKNYPPMHPMMMKPQNQRPPQNYPPGVPPGHPQFMHPQMPPGQMNPNLNGMVPPNMIPQGQNLPPQVMNNPNYQHLSLRRPSAIENQQPHIKMEPPMTANDQQTQLALSMRKKPTMNPGVPMPNGQGQMMQYQNIQPQPPQPQNLINQMNSPGNASPSNSQNPLLGSNTKDQGNSKSKPSELNTLGLKINNHNITGYDIVTKIFFGKKQIVWELMESGHEKKEQQNQETPSKIKEEDTGNDHNNDENSGAEHLKKKFDIRFNDIEAVEVNIEKSTMTIETPDGKPIFEADKPTKIIVFFPKDLLTRKNSSKNSHLDKIKACQLNMTIIGQLPETITPKNKPSMSPTVSMSNDQKIEEYSSMNNNASRYMLSGNAPYDDRHLANSDNPHFISLPMYNPQGINNNKNMVSQFNEKNVKVEPMLIEKKDDDYDGNEEGEMFPMLTKEKIIEIKRFEQEIKTKSDDDKVNLAINSLKIKRHPVSFFHKKYRCPYYKCYKSLNNPHLLKSHLVKKHPRLVEMGLNVSTQSETKVFDWSTQMIDHCLILAKTFPKFAKNVIREMKKRKNSNY